MSTISLRLPESLHKRVRELAKQENISINQFISTALAEKLSALLTLDYLEERGRRGKRSAFDRVLTKVRDVEPDKGDPPWLHHSALSEPEATEGDYHRVRNEDLPLDQYRGLVERMTDTRRVGKKLRSWTGNDKNARAHHGKVPLEEEPIYLELHWRRGPAARPRPVGKFKIRLGKLLRSGYVRLEDDGTVRLRFYHGRDGVIYIQRRLDSPGLPVGKP